MGVYVYTKPISMKETAGKIADFFGYRFYTGMDLTAGEILLVLDINNEFDSGDLFRFSNRGWKVIHLGTTAIDHLEPEMHYTFFETSDWSVDGLKTQIASKRGEMNLA